MLEHLFYTGYYTPADAVNAFFLYSFFGWCMECVVIRIEKGKWENRGFVHLPFCIIYGFGGMLGYVFLQPVSHNYLLLFCTGACMATLFEYLTARLMLHLFGSLWWDYSQKPFNYKGILCLESSIGWGVISLLLFLVFQKNIFRIVRHLQEAAPVVATVCAVAYAVDFAYCMRAALHPAQQCDSAEMPASEGLLEK